MSQSDFEQTIVYRVPGAHAGPMGKTFDYKGINSLEELRDALAHGWFMSILEAVNPAPVAEKAVEAPNEDLAPPTRAELEEKARELKIKFDGRTSDAKLAANIEAALNGLDKA